MSDIFLNYVIEDRAKAAQLVTVFEQQHWTVWWDASTITAGAEYDAVRAKEYNRAKVLISLLSRAGSGSLALGGAHNPRILPIHVQLEERYLPVQSMVPFFDLSDWAGAETHPGLQALLRHLHTLLPMPQRMKPSALSNYGRSINIIDLLVPHPSSQRNTSTEGNEEGLEKFLASMTAANKAPTDEPAKAAPSASLEELLLPEIPESALHRVKRPAVQRPEDEARFKGVFISYRRDDSAGYAGRLYDRLAAHFGDEQIFMDVDLIKPGEDFVRVIEEAVGSCGILLALIGRSWLTAGDEQGRRLDDPHDFVRLEIAAALARGVHVIPVRVQGAQMPRQHDLPEDLSQLARRQAFELSHTRWKRDVEVLITTLEGLMKD